MLLENLNFRYDISTISSFIDKICFDECHVIEQWGGADFRPIYGRVGNARATFPPHIPFLATSATLPKIVREKVFQVLHFRRNQTIVLNVGNDCPNIRTNIIISRGNPNCPDQFIDDIISDVKRGTLRRRMVFVDSLLGAQDLCEHVKTLLPKEMKNELNWYHAKLGDLSNEITMERFATGEISVLFTTEAAGMVS